MADPFKNITRSYEMPSNQFFDIVPSDVTDLAIVPRAIYIGSSGALSVIDEFGTTVTFTNLFQGTFLPIRVSRVLATGTGAAALIGMV